MLKKLRNILLMMGTGIFFLALTCTISYADSTTIHPDGLIKLGEKTYIHKYGAENNFFAGVWAGNLTMSGIGHNTGVGYYALGDNSVGRDNTAIGSLALTWSSRGSYNVAAGSSALEGNLTGSNNVALGYKALSKYNIGSDNIAIGYMAGENISGNRNIAIGNKGDAADSGVIRIGTGSQHFATLIAGIRNAHTVFDNAIPVLIDSQGQLGTTSSSKRFKKEIRDMADATNDLMKLRPVMFTYKDDATNTLQYGLIAEEVAEVYPELVTHSADGQVETVRYYILTNMLLNELQNQHRKVERLEADLADYVEMRTRVARLESLVQKLVEDVQ